MKLTWTNNTAVIADRLTTASLQSEAKEASGYSVIVVDTSRGIRRLDNARSIPSPLQSVHANCTLFDWGLHALSSKGIKDITYVGGYHIQKVIERYPFLRAIYHSKWQQEGELGGVRLASPNGDGYIIVRGNVLYTQEALARLLSDGGDICVGYYGRSKKHSLGMIAVPQAHMVPALELVKAVFQHDCRSDLESWISALVEKGFPMRWIDLDTLAAPADDSIALATVVFRGKGRTLEQIGPLLKSAVVLNQVRFPVAEWLRDSEGLLSRIQSIFTQGKIIVRSNAHSEDGIEESAAGRFESVLDIPSEDRESIRAGVETVVNSYTTLARELDHEDEILVQPQVLDLAASGTLLTRSTETGAPYYVLCIDRVSGRSDVVTSGSRDGIETFYIIRTADLEGVPAYLLPCIRLAKELEELTHLDSLDIEFGIDKIGRVFLFQVRPLPRKARRFTLADEDLVEELDQIRGFLATHLTPHPTLAGSTTLLGTMPDWNPAEMIGTAPRPLALSIYQRIIGSQAWAAARAEIGYEDVRPTPLIVSLGGCPYVDVRASLNSFLPAGLDKDLAKAWVDHCLDTLCNHPFLHDKIEFEVAITCLACDFEMHAKRLRRAGLDSKQIEHFRAKLLGLTDAILTDRVAPISVQFRRIEELSRRREALLKERSGSLAGLARRIQLLLSDCERWGTVPFSILARYAFIAMSMLRSLKWRGIFTEDEYQTILHSIPTIASDLARDMGLFSSGQLSADILIERYGHLRPSSYDITSESYASAWGRYFSCNQTEVRATSYPDISKANAIFGKHAARIQDVLREAGFTASIDAFQNFIVRSIPAREFGKFEFMKSVNAVLESIAEFGALLGISREDMSYLPVDLLVRGATDSPSGAVGMELRRWIEFNKKRSLLTSAIRLPHLVRSIGETHAFKLEEWVPNFISTRRVVAHPKVLESSEILDGLEERIVMIRAADPGYDWIFSHPIAGLITQYGGVASHMAIRAAEFGLPAAIGCGELIFERLRHAGLIELDCINRKLRAVS